MIHSKKKNDRKTASGVFVGLLVLIDIYNDCLSDTRFFHQ